MANRKLSDLNSKSSVRDQDLTYVVDGSHQRDSNQEELVFLF